MLPPAPRTPPATARPPRRGRTGPHSSRPTPRARAERRRGPARTPGRGAYRPSSPGSPRPSLLERLLLSLELGGQQAHEAPALAGGEGHDLAVPPVKVVREEEDLIAETLLRAYEGVKKFDRSRFAVYSRPQPAQATSRRILTPGPPLFSALSISARSLRVRSANTAVPSASMRSFGMSPIATRQRAIRAFLPCEAFSRTARAIFSSSVPRAGRKTSVS